MEKTKEKNPKKESVLKFSEIKINNFNLQNTNNFKNEYLYVYKIPSKNIKKESENNKDNIYNYSYLDLLEEERLQNIEKDFVYIKKGNVLYVDKEIVVKVNNEHIYPEKEMINELNFGIWLSLMFQKSLLNNIGFSGFVSNTPLILVEKNKNIIKAISFKGFYNQESESFIITRRLNHLNAINKEKTTKSKFLYSLENGVFIKTNSTIVNTTKNNNFTLYIKEKNDRRILDFYSAKSLDKLEKNWSYLMNEVVNNFIDFLNEKEVKNEQVKLSFKQYKINRNQAFNHLKFDGKEKINLIDLRFYRNIDLEQIKQLIVKEVNARIDKRDLKNREEINVEIFNNNENVDCFNQAIQKELERVFNLLKVNEEILDEFCLEENDFEKCNNKNKKNQEKPFSLHNFNKNLFKTNNEVKEPETKTKIEEVLNEKIIFDLLNKYKINNEKFLFILDYSKENFHDLYYFEKIFKKYFQQHDQNCATQSIIINENYENTILEEREYKIEEIETSIKNKIFVSFKELEIKNLIIKKKYEKLFKQLNPNNLLEEVQEKIYIIKGKVYVFSTNGIIESKLINKTKENEKDKEFSYSLEKDGGRVLFDFFNNNQLKGNEIINNISEIALEMNKGSKKSDWLLMKTMDESYISVDKNGNIIINPLNKKQVTFIPETIEENKVNLSDFISTRTKEFFFIDIPNEEKLKEKQVLILWNNFINSIDNNLYSLDFLKTKFNKEFCKEENNKDEKGKKKDKEGYFDDKTRTKILLKYFNIKPLKDPLRNTAGVSSCFISQQEMINESGKSIFLSTIINGIQEDPKDTITKQASLEKYYSNKLLSFEEIEKHFNYCSIVNNVSIKPFMLMVERILEENKI